MTGTTANNNRKYLMSGAALILVAAGAYGLGRVYPPLGPSAGTIAPSQRYQAPQVGEGDITLGGTSVPELMQTDAFELMVHDENFRALAATPGFKALAGQPQVMAALMSNPKAFAALAANPKAFAALTNAAQNASALQPKAHQATAQLMSAIAAHPAAMQALASHPAALAGIARNATAFKRRAQAQVRA